MCVCECPCQDGERTAGLNKQPGETEEGGPRTVRPAYLHPPPAVLLACPQRVAWARLAVALRRRAGRCPPTSLARSGGLPNQPITFAAHQGGGGLPLHGCVQVPAGLMPCRGQTDLLPLIFAAAGGVLHMSILTCCPSFFTAAAPWASVWPTCSCPGRSAWRPGRWAGDGQATG